jgi:hypothetical protein
LRAKPVLFGENPDEKYNNYSETETKYGTDMQGLRKSAVLAVRVEKVEKILCVAAGPLTLRMEKQRFTTANKRAQPQAQQRMREQNKIKPNTRREGHKFR